MAAEQAGLGHTMADMAGIEAQLAARLAEASREVAHIEFLDEEQRAEIYTILHAMKADTDAHCKLVGRWVSDVTGEVTEV